MTGPTRRREAVAVVRKQLPVSERRACQVLGQPRTTQRYRPKAREDDAVLVNQMHDLVRRHPRYGYRRIWAMLRADGWRVNVKRIYRLWRREGFRVPRRQRKKRRLGCSDNGIVRRRPEHKNHVWAWDFIHDRDERTRPLKWFVLIDEHTRECLALEVERSMKAVDVIDVLSQVLLIRGVPKHIRSDNGPEFIAQAMRRYLEIAEVGALYIEPGSPWENGYAESFFSRFRDEFLNRELFTDLADAKALSASWQNEYNHRRPHSSLDYQTPASFAAASGSAADAADVGGSAPKPPAPKPPRKAPGKKRPESVHHGQTLIAGGT